MKKSKTAFGNAGIYPAMKCSGEGDKSDMRKEQVLSRMREECLIAVIRAKNSEQGEKIV